MVDLHVVETELEPSIAGPFARSHLVERMGNAKMLLNGMSPPHAGITERNHCSSEALTLPGITHQLGTLTPLDVPNHERGRRKHKYSAGTTYRANRALKDYQATYTDD